MTGVNEVTFGEVPDPNPGVFDVVVSVAGSGICGTDLHILAGEHHSNFPLIPGHEFSGEVVSKGSRVTSLEIGDLVAVDPNLPCLYCKFCRLGRANLCLNYSAIGVTLPGSAAEFVSVPEAACFKLPENVDILQAPLIEPLSCVVHAFDLLGSLLGKRMVIYGAGTMGLMMLQLALNSGIESVDVVDPNNEKLRTALILGSQKSSSVASDIDTGQGWDVVVDATGVLAAVQDGLGRVDRGGTFLQFGVSNPEVTVSINPYQIYEREIRIIGAVCPLNSFGRAMELLSQKKISAEILISDYFPLVQYQDALKLFVAGTSRKIVMLPKQ